jgi:hypothetical protein
VAAAEARTSLFATAATKNRPAGVVRHVQPAVTRARVAGITRGTKADVASYLSSPITSTASRLMVVPVAEELLVPVHWIFTVWLPGVRKPLDQTVCL